MNTVTIIDTKEDRKGRLKVFLDIGQTFSLSVRVAVEAGIHSGKVLSHSEIEKLKNSDKIHRSFNSALKYISPRPRSEMEIRTRLNRHGFDKGTVHQVMAQLKQQGLIDDAAFARFWRENRENFKPLSRRLMELELKRKGVNVETISEAIIGVDDELGAYRAACKKIRSLSGLDYSSFRKRLGSFLKRRGFDYELINRTIDRVWQEQGYALPR
jgi:regulatory protein